MTPEEKTAIISAIERKIKSTEAAIVEYKDMTQPVAPDVAIAALVVLMPLIIKVIWKLHFVKPKQSCND